MKRTLVALCYGEIARFDNSFCSEEGVYKKQTSNSRVDASTALVRLACCITEGCVTLKNHSGMSDQCIETSILTVHLIISPPLSLKTWRNESQMLVLQIRTPFPTNLTKNAKSHAYVYTLGFYLPPAPPKCPTFHTTHKYARQMQCTKLSQFRPSHTLI
jgi:hypothetical protein